MNAPNTLGTHLRANKGRRFWALLLTGATVLAACGSSSSSSGTSSNTTPTTSGSGNSQASSSASKSPYTINAILSETGAGSFLGSREAKALQAFAAVTNNSGGIDGHPLKFSIKDDQSSPSTSVSLASPLIASGVPIVVIGSLVAVDASVDALATAKGPFIYDLSPGAHPKPGGMVFSAGISTTYQTQAYLTYLKSKGLTRIAAITSTDASGVDGWTQLNSALSQPQFSSMKLLDHETFSPTAVSVTTQLSVIKAKNPQALVIWTTGTPLGVVLQGMSSLGMESIPTVTTTGNASFSELQHFASILPTTFYFPTGGDYLTPSEVTNSAEKSVLQTFDTAVTGAGGHPGDAWALAWDTAIQLTGAIKQLGVNATAAQVLSYMENLKNSAGSFGMYNFSDTARNGTSLQDITMTRWNGSAYVPVSGPGGAPLSSGSAG